MKIREKIFRPVLLLGLFIFVSSPAVHAQIDLHLDTIECHIVGFNFGMKFPSSLYSFETTPDGTHSQLGTAASLYKAPWMDYGINAIYKYKNNWLVTLDGNMWIGNDNLQNRLERMGSIYTRDSIVISTGGYDAVVTCFNRGLSFMGGVGKIFPLLPEKNPNSGIFARLQGGYMFQQTIFKLNHAQAPQLDHDYALLYDHQRQGFILGEGLGFWFMSNHANLINFYVELGLQQCWSHSTRDYTIDYHLGLQGKDNNHYFDMIYSLKLCWMFPLKGRQAHDIYFY
jgi:hypothetical protein